MSPTPANARGGIDLGGTKIQTVIVSARNRVLGEARRPTPTEGGPEDVAAEMAACLREAADGAGVETEKLLGVGIGSPGDANQETGVVSGASNLPGWEGSFPLAENLEKDLGAPAFVGNDVQVAVDGEFALGAAKPFDSVLGVFWGTGVGGGLVLNGKPWLGRGAAGEVGHMLIRRGGPRCSAGHSGCIEAYAGRSMMERKARSLAASGEKTDLFRIMEQRGRDRLTSGVWERALKHDDKVAHELIKRATKALGEGIASAINLLDPEAVILGGGMGVRFGERYLPRIKKAMEPYLFDPKNPPPVLLAELGDLGGAIGAALLAKKAR
ncbi:MAG: ROK family protein [Actinobacteria bacterium]|nr:ROK family protein [Actinomycetota bacterium]